MTQSHMESVALAPARPKGWSWRPAASWRGSGYWQLVPVLIVGVLLALLVIPPVIVLIYSSLSPNGEIGGGVLSLVNYIELFTGADLYRSSLNSITLAFGATVVTLLIGGVLAWIVERTDAPFKILAHLTAIVSLGTPSIIYVSSWLFLLGRVGPLNQFYRWATGSTDNLLNVYSLWGMIMIEGLLWTPLVFLLLSASFRRANADMEEAARICGASTFQTVWMVSLKLAWPAIAGVSLFVFIRNLESFDVPVLVGMPSRISLLTTDIYLSMTQAPPRLGNASSFSVVLIVVVAILLHYYGKISKSADRYASMTGKGYRPRPFRLGGARWIAGAIIIVAFIVVLVLPIIGILWTSLSPFARPITLQGLSNLTFDHYAVLFDTYYIQLAINTFLASGLAATLAVVITVVAAWLAVRRFPGGGILDQLASMPLVFPGIVLGVAMIQVALRVPIPIYGTIWLIAFAFAIRYLPYGMRYAYSGIMQVHRELEEVAGVSGASQTGIIRRIVAPMVSPAIVAGWLFIFLLASKELTIAVLLAAPGTQTMAVSMFSLWNNGQAGEVAAMGFVWTLLLTCAAALMQYFVGRRTNLNLEH